VMTHKAVMTSLRHSELFCVITAGWFTYSFDCVCLRSVHWSVGWPSVSWWVGWSISQSVDHRSAGWPLGQLVSWAVSWPLVCRQSNVFWSTISRSVSYQLVSLLVS